MGEEEEVKVLGLWASPFVLRVEWALKLKGIKYGVVEVDLVNKSPLLLNSNPIYKKVPVLIHNGNSINESLVIIEYIDETWKHNPILPLDPYHKALERFWAKFVEEKITEVVRRVIFSKGEEQEKEVKEAKEALEVIEEQLKGKKYFGGDKIGLIDIVLGWICIWLGVVEEACLVKIFDSEKCACIAKWMVDFVELPFVKQNLPPRDQLANYYQNVRHSVLTLPASN